MLCVKRVLTVTSMISAGLVSACAQNSEAVITRSWQVEQALNENREVCRYDAISDALALRLKEQPGGPQMLDDLSGICPELTIIPLESRRGDLFASVSDDDNDSFGSDSSSGGGDSSGGDSSSGDSSSGGGDSSGGDSSSGGGDSSGGDSSSGGGDSSGGDSSSGGGNRGGGSNANNGGGNGSEGGSPGRGSGANNDES